MRTGDIETKQLLKHFQVSGATPEAVAEPIYVLGSFEQRVTLYSQQVRALNLVHALFAERRLVAGSRVAVIGGGASGVTAAVALAHLGASVELIEQTDVLLPLQQGCRTRWIHPHIYDWPEAGSEDEEAALPLVGWRAGYAHDVARSLAGAFDRACEQSGERIRLTLSARVQSVTGGGRPRVSWQGRSPGGEKVVRTGKDFDAVIVAVGFGIEVGSEQLPMSSYWRNDDLDQPVLRLQQEVRCLVSGNGDGGLIEILRLRLRDFRLETLHKQLRDSLDASELQNLASRLLEYENEVDQQSDGWLWDKYNSLELPQRFIDSFKRFLRSDTRVWLAAPRSPLSFRSAILNRLWVTLLVMHDTHTTWVPSATQQVVKQGAVTVVTYADQAATHGVATEFDRVILRHGPTSALVGALQWIGDRCRAVLRPRNALDQTRWPIWKPEQTFGPHRAIVAAAPPTAVAPPLVREPVASASAAVEEWVAASMAPRPETLTSATVVGAPVAPAALAPVGPRSSPGAVSKSVAAETAEVVVATGSASRRGFGLELVLERKHEVEFLEHCRVDRESVRAACSDPARGVPELHWHLAIRRPMELVLQSAAGLDDLVRTSTWLRRGDDRDADVPAFKQSFFDDLKRLARAQEEAMQELRALWHFLVDSGRSTATREAAVSTFAGLAALRMIARLRRFEGALRSSDGRTIVDLFPDLPPIRSPWLVRRVPYRSPAGGLALGAEQLLLCCVGPSMDSFHYFLLPRQIAESAQGDPEGLPPGVFFRWIVPQWYFQKYEGTPRERQVVWVLADEYGRERRDASARTPWRSHKQMEEEPHPTVTLGELQELEPKWHVVTLPLEPDASSGGRRPVQPPLTGRNILWVDDNPDNNIFEVRYLEQLGAAVSHAASTAQALAHVSSRETDLVISDMSRFEGGQRRSFAGIELLERARELQGGRARPVPIIFYTGNRSRVPAELRSIAADHEQLLFKLVLENLRS
ncbi:MAG TPA: FAD-dependent oxidoreductase [Kofleriaceae bacterium]|nr:FAD-dependent oxidoreductase [Kofleriaceae bacterium]